MAATPKGSWWCKFLILNHLRNVTWLENKKHKNNQKSVDKFAVFAIFPLSPLTAQQLQPIEKKTICH